MENLKICLGVPHNFPMMYSAFVDSLVLLEKPFDFVYIREWGGTPIDQPRNAIVETGLKEECTHIIMMDSDQTYPSDVIVKMLKHDLPIVGGLIHRRYPPFEPLLFKGSINAYESIEDFKYGELLSVDATGTGCLLFKTEVFKNMPKPWFKFRENPDSEKTGIIGEDIGFCYDLRQKGYEIFVDTSIKIGHLSLLEINEGTHKLYKYMKNFQKQTSIKEEIGDFII